MNNVALGTCATVTVTGPGIVIGLINSGGDPGSMNDAVSTVCGDGVGVGVGVVVGVGVAVGVGVVVGVGVAVGAGVGVGVGVGVPNATTTVPRGELAPS